MRALIWRRCSTVLEDLVQTRRCSCVKLAAGQALQAGRSYCVSSNWISTTGRACPDPGPRPWHNCWFATAPIFTLRACTGSCSRACTPPVKQSFGGAMLCCVARAEHDEIVSPREYRHWPRMVDQCVTHSGSRRQPEASFFSTHVVALRAGWQGLWTWQAWTSLLGSAHSLDLNDCSSPVFLTPAYMYCFQRFALFRRKRLKYLLYTCMGTVTHFFCVLGLALCLVPGLCDLLCAGMHHCLTRLMRGSSWRDTPHTFFQTAGRPRPKSGGSSHVRCELLFMWVVCAMLHCLPQAAVAAKVATVSTPVAGAASEGSTQVIHPEAKPGGVFHMQASEHFAEQCTGQPYTDTPNTADSNSRCSNSLVEETHRAYAAGSHNARGRKGLTLRLGLKLPALVFLCWNVGGQHLG